LKNHIIKGRKNDLGRLWTVSQSYLETKCSLRKFQGLKCKDVEVTNMTYYFYSFVSRNIFILKYKPKFQTFS
jgi:hypothetical protein